MLGYSISMKHFNSLSVRMKQLMHITFFVFMHYPYISSIIPPPASSNPFLLRGGWETRGFPLENLSAAGEILADFGGSNDEIYYRETRLEGAKCQIFRACGVLTLPKALKHYK